MVPYCLPCGTDRAHGSHRHRQTSPRTPNRTAKRTEHLPRRQPPSQAASYRFPEVLQAGHPSAASHRSLSIGPADLRNPPSRRGIPLPPPDRQHPRMSRRFSSPHTSSHCFFRCRRIWTYSASITTSADRRLRSLPHTKEL